MGPSGVAPASYSYTYGTNRLADLDGVSIITDPTGNITDGGNGVTFIYGLRNRMTSSTNAQGTTTYSYNALGERVKKSGPGGTTIFAYDEEGHLIGEYTGAGVMIQEIVWFEGLPVASLRPAAAGGIEIFNISSDHLGTPRVIRRATDGVIVWRWDSDPFGVASPNENPSGAGEFKFNLRFPGQYADAETGLNYNYFRDYNPKTGRYVQSDPIGLKGGINTYGYAHNNPLSFVDPLGLDTEICKRPFYPFPSPIARHCFIRFNQNDKDTLSFDSTGVHQDPAASKNYWPRSCTETQGNEADDCVRIEMGRCKAEDYDFTGFNCCHCAEQALKTCGLTVPVSWWPNWPINPGPQPEELSNPTFDLVP